MTALQPERFKQWRSARPHDFDSFYADNLPKVRRFLQSRCSDPELAEDAAQDAFFVAYLRWADVSQHAKPLAWIMKTASYKLSEALRKEARRPRVSIEEIRVDFADQRDHYEAKDATRICDQLLATLEPAERRAILLDSWGWSEREGAAIMTVTLQTFRTYKRNGRRKLTLAGQRFGPTEGGTQ